LLSAKPHQPCHADSVVITLRVLNPAAFSLLLLLLLLLYICMAVVLLLQWAVLERRQGDYAAAARAFQRGSACAPRNPHIWYLWATMTWREVKDYRAARRLFERATQYCPRWVTTRVLGEGVTGLCWGSSLTSLGAA